MASPTSSNSMHSPSSSVISTLPASSSSTAMPFPNLIKRFDDSNYVVWKTCLTPFLMSSQLLLILKGTKKALPKIVISANGTLSLNPNYTAWLIHDQAALSWLMATSTNSIVTQLTDMSSSTEAWAYLKQSYTAQSTACASALRMELQTITCSSQTVTKFLSQIKNILNQLGTIGVKISNLKYVTQVFQGLGEEFDGLAMFVLVVES